MTPLLVPVMASRRNIVLSSSPLDRSKVCPRLNAAPHNSVVEGLHVTGDTTFKLRRPVGGLELGQYVVRAKRVLFPV